MSARFNAIIDGVTLYWRATRPRYGSALIAAKKKKKKTALSRRPSPAIFPPSPAEQRVHFA